MFAILTGNLAFADSRPEFEFQPSSVTLPVVIGQQATALVVIHNRTEAAMHDVRLTWLPTPGLDVQPATPPLLPVLAPHADYAWTLTLKPSIGLPASATAGVTTMVRPPGPAASPAPAPSVLAGNLRPPVTRVDQNIDFVLNYTTDLGGQERPQVTLKSLPVRTQDLGELNKAVEVEIKAALDSLGSSDSGSIYLVLKNNSARTFNISVTPIGTGELYCRNKRPRSLGRLKSAAQEDSLPFCFSSPIPPAVLTPYQTLVQDLRVKANDRLRPGKYVVVFQIMTQSWESGTPLWRSIVASQSVDVDLLGESAILKIALIPVFLLLPGMLLLLTVCLCRTLEGRWWRAADDEAFPLTHTDPNFWLVSVFLSLLIAIVPWLFTGHWYITRYGLQDIALLWFASILTGAVCYLFWWAYRHNRSIRVEEKAQMQAELEARKLQEPTFSEHHSP